MSIDLAFTNSGGKEFQMLTILLEKKFSCQLLLQIGLISFLLCPLVTEVWGANLKKASTLNISDFPFMKYVRRFRPTTKYRLDKSYDLEKLYMVLKL